MQLEPSQLLVLLLALLDIPLSTSHFPAHSTASSHPTTSSSYNTPLSSASPTKQRKSTNYEVTYSKRNLTSSEMRIRTIKIHSLQESISLLTGPPLSKRNFLISKHKLQLRITLQVNSKLTILFLPKQIGEVTEQLTLSETKIIKHMDAQHHGLSQLYQLLSLDTKLRMVLCTVSQYNRFSTAAMEVIVPAVMAALVEVPMMQLMTLV